MASGNLTTTLVDRAHRRGVPCELPDGAGLYFRKQTASGAAWELRYRFLGRSRYLTVGHYPDMPLAMAREEARARRVMIDKGLDPAEERRRAMEEQRKRALFRDLAEDWYRNDITNPKKKIKHPLVARRYLDTYLLPKFGHLAAADLRARDICAMLDGIKERAPSVANDALRFAQRIFAFGVRRDILPFNPISDLTPRLDGGGTERPRQRALSHQELETFFEAIKTTENFGGDNLIAITLLLALCCRKMELLAARWEEFDLVGTTDLGPVWHVPGARTKTGEPLDIPIVPHVLEWLCALKVMSGGSPCVFPQRRRDHRRRYAHISPDTLNVALHRVAHGLRPFTIHDLRRSARTQLAVLGVRSEVAERCLGHKLHGIEGTYNVHDYFNERRAALELWTNVLAEIASGQRRVVPIRPAMLSA